MVQSRTTVSRQLHTTVCCKISNFAEEPCCCVAWQGNDVRWAACSAYLLTAQAQAEGRPWVGAHVQLVLLLELVRKVVEEDVVQIAAAKVPVPGMRQHAQLALLEGHNGHLGGKAECISGLPSFTIQYIPQLWQMLHKKICSVVLFQTKCLHIAGRIDTTKLCRLDAEGL